MAQQVKVSWLDDVDGTDAAETVSFELDGRAYEIDLSEHNAARLRELLAGFVAAGRRIGGRAAAARPAASERTPAIRAWAQEQGLTVPARGRLSGDIVRAYDERRRPAAPAAAPAPAPVVEPQRARVSPPLFSGLA